MMFGPKICFGLQRWQSPTFLFLFYLFFMPTSASVCLFGLNNNSNNNNNNNNNIYYVVVARVASFQLITFQSSLPSEYIHAFKMQKKAVNLFLIFFKKLKKKKLSL